MRTTSGYGVLVRSIQKSRTLLKKVNSLSPPRNPQSRSTAVPNTQPPLVGGSQPPPKPIITKRGKTTIRRYPGRSFHSFEEAKGKALDYIEFFTMGEYHCIDISFEDKTAMHFVIEPSFTLETGYADWKTGNWRSIKKWPNIRSASFNS